MNQFPCVTIAHVMSCCKYQHVIVDLPLVNKQFNKAANSESLWCAIFTRCCSVSNRAATTECVHNCLQHSGNDSTIITNNNNLTDADDKIDSLVSCNAHTYRDLYKCIFMAHAPKYSLKIKKKIHQVMLNFVRQRIKALMRQLFSRIFAAVSNLEVYECCAAIAELIDRTMLEQHYIRTTTAEQEDANKKKQQKLQKKPKVIPKTTHRTQIFMNVFTHQQQQQQQAQSNEALTALSLEQHGNEASDDADEAAQEDTTGFTRKPKQQSYLPLFAKLIQRDDEL